MIRTLVYVTSETCFKYVQEQNVGHKYLPFSVTLSQAIFINACFKSVHNRAHAYICSFLLLTVRQWNLLPKTLAIIVRIEKFNKNLIKM